MRGCIPTDAMTQPIFYLGNKNYSSWSLRPWLALTWGNISFEERIVQLGGPGYGKSASAAILAVSPTGCVPVLHLGDWVIHDSLAICEWAAEQTPSLWPVDASERAFARSISAEMHAGFSALRTSCPMNLRLRTTARDWNEETRSDIARVQAIWKSLRTRYASRGPWLFGSPTIADAMYAPICTRFRSYGVELEPLCQSYCETLFADPAFRSWETAALEDPLRLE